MAETVAWAEVERCFADRHNPLAVIRRLSDEWADRFDLPQGILVKRVERETWSAEQVGRHLDCLAQIEPRLITDQQPRRLDGPLVLIDFGKGRVGQIDGRRRANVWRHQPGRYEVLRICVF